jgi:acetoin utilization deacetylase AcuC-like enzyme
MLVTAKGFAQMTQMLMESAADTAKNRLVIAHEGGYNAVYSPFCGLFVLQQLSGVHKLDDPFSHTDAYPGQILQEHQKVEIDLAALNI